uniref:Uncharacterized protein n=1 Tax=Oryza glumipatula TaxID=40148 RepID=A0A0E0A0U2_9ORYZ
MVGPTLAFRPIFCAIISLISNVQNRSRIACAVAFPVPSHLRPLITPPPQPRRFSPPLTPLPPPLTLFRRSGRRLNLPAPLPIHHRRNTMETSSRASSRPLTPSCSPLLWPLDYRRHRCPVRRCTPHYSNYQSIAARGDGTEYNGIKSTADAEDRDRHDQAQRAERPWLSKLLEAGKADSVGPPRP